MSNPRSYQSLLEFVDVTIPSGAAVSDWVDLKGKTVVAVITPSAWTSAAISFDTSRSDDGSDPTPRYTADGEVTIPSTSLSTTQARDVAMDPVKLWGIRHLRVRSGTAAAPVNQGADRVITLALRAI